MPTRRDTIETIVEITSLMPSSGFVAVYWDPDNTDPETPIITDPIIAWAGVIKAERKGSDLSEVEHSRQAYVVGMVMNGDTGTLDPAEDVSSFLGICMAGMEHQFGSEARERVIAWHKEHSSHS